MKTFHGRARISQEPQNYEKLVRSNDHREVKELINLMIKTLKKKKEY